jgi:hypothetical protein
MRLHALHQLAPAYVCLRTASGFQAHTKLCKCAVCRPLCVLYAVCAYRQRGGGDIRTGPRQMELTPSCADVLFVVGCICRQRGGGGVRRGPRQMELPEHISRMVGHANLLYASNK